MGLPFYLALIVRMLFEFKELKMGVLVTYEQKKQGEK